MGVAPAATSDTAAWLLSQRTLRRILGLLWIADGLFQLQPQMFTMNMINGVMVPMTQGQPELIGRNLAWITQVTSQNLTLVNLVIATVQVGLGGLLLTGLLLRPTVIASAVWALAVWYGGEGMSMLMTGQASVLSGAPGAVLLYALLGFALYPKEESGLKSAPRDYPGLLSRPRLCTVLGCLWVLFGLLQLQPYWWQRAQIAGAIEGMTGMGGLNTRVFDPSMLSVAHHLTSVETAWNLALILLCFGIGLSILMSDVLSLPYPLVVSALLSGVVWWFTQAFGGILSGMATDFNSGLLLVLLAAACMPIPHRRAKEGGQLVVASPVPA